MKTSPVCNDCNIKFENKRDLEEHMKTDHKQSNTKKNDVEVTCKKELPFDCNYCDRRFTSRCRLKNHVKIHNTQEESREDGRDRSFLQEEGHN